MKYGDLCETFLVNRFTKERHPYTYVYRYAEWNGYHTNNRGDGLWCGMKQIIGTCDFTVAGCKTEKAAKAKIRNYVNGND